MILVTGASGLLGSHLLYELTSQGKQCIAVCRSKENLKNVERLFHFYSPENASDYFSQIEWIYGDLLDLCFLNDLFPRVTSVYHCAAKVSFYKADFLRCIKQNREVTANIVNYCLKYNVGKLCYVSSTAAIGANKDGFTTEKDKWEADAKNSGYSISKYSAEKEVWRGIEEGLNAVMINPCVILGPGNWNSGSLTIFKTAKKGLLFYPTGSNSIVDARDVALSMRLLMDSDLHTERYLCVGVNLSYKELFTEISKRLNTQVPKYKAPESLAKFIAVINEFLCRISGVRKGLTIETANSAYKQITYDVSKIKSAIPIKFHNLEETIENVLKFKTFQV